MFDMLTNVRKIAAILSPKRHIFLLSHMRSYTSLFGHIMGSNPEICGYYEMHIGYYSWRSLIRQKLLYFQQENPKRQFTYMFDKVLHNEHHLSLTILNSRRTKPIFCLRRPQDAIPSILKLYQRVDPTHELNSEAVATAYYIERLTMLERIADSLQREFFYLDAETLKLDTQECLQLLSDWLGLKSTLSSEYDIQRNTSRERFGDSSERLRIGRVLNDTSDYANFKHNGDLLSHAVQAYNSARLHMIQSSAHRCVIQSSAPL